MKLTDYFPIASCPMCGKTVYTPRSWVGLNKDKTYTPAPNYPTCMHNVDELLRKRRTRR